MSPARAVNIVRERLANRGDRREPLETFAAIGGTWRALARLHQARCKYPLHMVQHYEVPVSDILPLCDALVEDRKQVAGMDTVASARRGLLPYGAAVLAEILRAGGFKTVVFSALGVREGYLYDRLEDEERDGDPLIEACKEISVLRSRAPEFAGTSRAARNCWPSWG